MDLATSCEVKALELTSLKIPMDWWRHFVPGSSFFKKQAPREYNIDKKMGEGDRDLRNSTFVSPPPQMDSS